MQRSFPRLDDKPGPSGRYVIKWAERPDAAAKWITRRYSTGTNDRREAEQVFASFLSAGGAERHDRDQTPVFASVCEAYFDRHVRRDNRAEETTARWNLKWPLEFFGRLRLAAITPALVEDYVARRRAGVLGRRGGAADTTIRRELVQLRAVCAWAERKGEAPKGSNPVFDLPQGGRRRQGDYAWMDEKTVERWLLSLTNTGRSDALIFGWLGSRYGARREAITDLTWDRVDFEKGRIDFRNPTKRETRKRRAIVPLVDDKTRALLLNARDDEGYRAEHGVYVVGRLGAERYDRWRKAHPEFGWVSAHILRHTCATLMLRRGVDLFTVAGVLADDPATVSKVYGHHRPDHLAAAFQ